MIYDTFDLEQPTQNTEVRRSNRKRRLSAWPDSGSNDVCPNDGRTKDYSMKRDLFEREKSEMTFIRNDISQKRYKSQPIFVRKRTISKCHPSEWSFV